MDQEKYRYLCDLAHKIRYNTMDCIGSIGVGHVGGSLSIVDLLAVLYGAQMRYRCKEPHWEGRDRLILSKGHAGPALYATLAELGFFPVEALHTLNQPETNLPSHADMNRTPGVDMTAGSLGQGFSCAVGIALASQLCQDDATIYTIIGDGESEEGEIWEAAMTASHYHLDRLIAFTDYNKMQIDGTVLDVGGLENLEDKWRAFGWVTLSIDGHDLEQIDSAISFAKSQRGRGKPIMIVMNTIKGKGVSYAENLGVMSHNFEIGPDLRDAILKELR